MPDDEMPIGARLGSERLYQDPPLGSPQLGPVGPLRNPAPNPPKRAKKDKNQANPPPQPTRERRPTGEPADVNWREIAGNALEMIGITAITAGSWLIAAWLGLIVLGLCLILLGAAISIQRSP